MKLPAELIDQLKPFYTGRSVCVTGAAGFIGGHLTDALLALGSTVSTLDDLSNSTLDHLAPLIELEPDRVRFTHGSILDDDALDDAVETAAGPARTVFHLAAEGSVPKSVEHPQRSWSVNSTGTVRVLEAARRHWSRHFGAAIPPDARIVFAGSSSAYGDDPSLPKLESQVSKPKSPYAASKLAGEAAVTAWSHAYDLSGVTLRFFNIFGPRQSPDSAYAAVIAAFAKRLMAGEPATIFGDGTQTRDFTFVANAVAAMLLAGASPKPLKGEVLNVGTGRRISLLELHQLMAQRFGSPHAQPTFAPLRAGDVPHSVADISRATAMLGYRPIATLEEGLDETVTWFRRAFNQSHARRS